jgi:DNA topoisomerase-1
VREAHKLERLGVFAAALPKIRRRIASDLRQPGTGRLRALTAVVTLVDRTHIRIGHEDCVHSGRSRGAASLLKRNVRVEGQRIHLTFRGKGGKDIACSLRSPALAAALADLAAIPGRRLFQYRDDDGRVRRITAHDVNEHLRLLAAAPVSAKDFRTLAATAAAAECLLALERAQSDRPQAPACIGLSPGVGDTGRHAGHRAQKLHPAPRGGGVRERNP